MNRLFYRAAGRSLEIVESVAAQGRVARAAQIAFMANLGAIGYTTAWGRILGFLFDTPPADPVALGLRAKMEEINGPDGVVRVLHYHPNQRTKAGKTLSARMLALPCGPDGPGWTEALIGQPWILRGNRAHYCTLEKLGETWVIGVPETWTGATPPDGEPLKNSEYWLMKEDMTP